MNHLGVVVIGRNEGERLRRCLCAVCVRNLTVVYVDSNSTDGSSALARALGAEVVELDLSQPFTAARARNAGFAQLEEIDADVRFVQFVDGDCELADGWLARASRVLEERPEVAVVCGRRRERFPEQSIYNRLADLEWNTPIGEAKYCGGDAMMRVAAFRRVGGFNPQLIAGEEPELCVRLRQNAGLILRIDAEMTLHDIAMTRFVQWWKRAERAGFAYAQGAMLHGAPPECHWIHDVRSIVIWSILLPLATLSLAWPSNFWSLGLVLVYPLQVIRVARRHHKFGKSQRDAWLYGTACVLSRFPNAVGLLRYALNRLLGWRQSLIEYKKSTAVRISSDQRV
jgi:glycosyltransferase involved in cell wall biosynthesis